MGTGAKNKGPGEEQKRRRRDPGITEEQKTKEGPGGRTIRRSKRRRLRDLNLTEEQKVGAAKAAKAHTTAHTHHGRLYQQRNSA